MDESIFDEAELSAQIERASRASEIANSIEPRAKSAHYDVASGLVVIALKNGATFSFPSQIAQGISGAPVAALSEIELTPSGDGLHWELLDVDLHVPSLLAGIFGTRAWIAQLQAQWKQAS